MARPPVQPDPIIEQRRNVEMLELSARGAEAQLRKLKAQEDLRNLREQANSQKSSDE